LNHPFPAQAKFAHVNKKALDQYVNFADQRALLLDRRRELDEGATAIEDLIRTLDAKKDEAIDRTFRGVSKHFADVFSELVPDGEAKLVMVKRPVADVPSQSSASSLSVDAGPFVGVQVAVQFPGAAAAHAHVSMNQLSGGQKALVALALVFAIQRCDPAPFYLFDEIDAALDANHRAAVAALVKRQAAAEDAPAQFITTTFRPEFVTIQRRAYFFDRFSRVEIVLRRSTSPTPTSASPSTTRRPSCTTSPRTTRSPSSRRSTRRRRPRREARPTPLCCCCRV
jgi:structural maintenance of chromosome 3 (chondroitin sulfate proteoglycan 6)